MSSQVPVHTETTNPNTHSTNEYGQGHGHGHGHQHDQTNTNTNTATTPSSNRSLDPTTHPDPSTHPQAKPTTKLMGDIKGAAHGVVGSVQAATGTVLRNQEMADKGFEKMQDEDARLLAKRGKPPVGTETREETVAPIQASSQASSSSYAAPAQEPQRGL